MVLYFLLLIILLVLLIIFVNSKYKKDKFELKKDLYNIFLNDIQKYEKLTSDISTIFRETLPSSVKVITVCTNSENNPALFNWENSLINLGYDYVILGKTRNGKDGSGELKNI